MTKKVRKGIDALLNYRNRTLRTLPGKLLFGPTGKRLFVDYLDKTPGFAGRVDFIHKLNLPGLFWVSAQGYPHEIEAADTVWYPSHLHMDYADDRVTFEEEKFITWDDIAVSLQCWANLGQEPLRLSLRICDGFQLARQDDGVALLSRDCLSHDLQLIGAVASSNTRMMDKGELTLAPGETARFALACAMGEAAHDTPAQRAHDVLAYLLSGDYLRAQTEEYDGWFDDVPVFDSDDALLNTTWWYRWFILRHCYAEPNLGNFKHGVFYEGRSHKSAKEPYAPWGHEFSQLIPMSSSMHVMDARWKHDGSCCRETLKTLLDSMDAEGIFRMMMVDKFGFTFGNFDAWGFYQYFLAHRDKNFVRDVLEGYKKNVRGVWEAYRGDKGDLQIAYNHRRPGKEYQPAYWYFNGFPNNAAPEDSYTWLKRVDLSIYLYLNARGVEALAKEVGDEEAAEFAQLADRIRDQVLADMWDEETGFFYDLHYQTHEKALVKGVTGIYPLWAGITGEEHRRVIDPYLDANEFATGSVFASVSKQCPVFYPQGSWKGNFYKGRDGCMWDGPSWPYTSCIALDAIAMDSKRHGHGRDADFAKFLREYAWQHFRNKSLHEPYLVEHYNAVTGEMLSDDVDYNHSYFIDLIVRHVAGLAPTTEGFVIDPVDAGLNRFSLDNVLLNGLQISIRYERGKAFEVWVNEERVLQSDGLTRFAYAPRGERAFE